MNILTRNLVRIGASSGALALALAGSPSMAQTGPQDQAKADGGIADMSVVIHPAYAEAREVQ